MIVPPLFDDASLGAKLFMLLHRVLLNILQYLGYPTICSRHLQVPGIYSPCCNFMLNVLKGFRNRLPEIVMRFHSSKKVNPDPDAGKLSTAVRNHSSSSQQLLKHFNYCKQLLLCKPCTTAFLRNHPKAKNVKMQTPESGS